MSSATIGAGDFADLHALVDGRLDRDRRAATLRRLATSPSDRTRVEAWQSQRDLLQASFANIEREPLPAMLDLTARPRLHCIPTVDAPLVDPAHGDRNTSSRRARIATALATIVVISSGLGGSWFLLETSRPNSASGLGGLQAASRGVHAPEPGDGTDSRIAPRVEIGLARLPTAEIPDLRATGFGFTSAETTSSPLSIVFRYQAGSDEIAVRVTRVSSSSDDGSQVKKLGNGYVWQAGDKSYVVTGTVPPERLRGIAAAVRQETLSD